jgi:hypothetical protein
MGYYRLTSVGAAPSMRNARTCSVSPKGRKSAPSGLNLLNTHRTLALALGCQPPLFSANGQLSGAAAFIGCELEFRVAARLGRVHLLGAGE